jgi:hypothetical protein
MIEYIKIVINTNKVCYGTGKLIIKANQYCLAKIFSYIFNASIYIIYIIQEAKNINKKLNILKIILFVFL